jgi:hypothetical protein
MDEAGNFMVAFSEWPVEIVPTPMASKARCALKEGGKQGIPREVLGLVTKLLQARMSRCF